MAMFRNIRDSSGEKLLLAYAKTKAHINVASYGRLITVFIVHFLDGIMQLAFCIKIKETSHDFLFCLPHCF